MPGRPGGNYELLFGYPGLVAAIAAQAVVDLFSGDEGARMSALYYLAMCAGDDLEAAGLDAGQGDLLGALLRRRSIPGVKQSAHVRSFLGVE